MRFRTSQFVIGLLLCLPVTIPRDLRAADCNENGVDDEVDISAGWSDDCNQNGGCR